MYADLLAWLEASSLGHAARHSAWLFTVANLLLYAGVSLGAWTLALLAGRLIAYL